MNEFTVLLKKEWLETVRSYKILWIPLLFILLGVMDPVTTYYMEDILASVGNVPEGFELSFPELSPADVLLSSTGQFQSIGIIVLISAFIGIISRERQNGTATLLYVRPISPASVFLSKWVMASLICISGVTIGYLASMYYTWVLYGTVEVDAFIKMLLTYWVWILFVMAVTVAMSAAFQTGIAATIAITLIPIGLLVDSVIGNFWTYSPWKLVNYGIDLLNGATIDKSYTISLSLTILLIILFLLLGIFATKQNWRTTKV